MNRELVEIVAQYVLFLEREESEIPLETAVKQQEDLAYRLQKMTEDDRKEFVRVLADVARNMRSENDREILGRLPEEAGIA